MRASELLERERLRHVVVGPGIETGDTVLDLVAGREHQHRHAVAIRAEPPADLETVHARHQHVEEHGVGLAFAVPSSRWSASWPSAASSIS